jgi:hypothetical protein
VQETKIRFKLCLDKSALHFPRKEFISQIENVVNLIISFEGSSPVWSYRFRN